MLVCRDLSMGASCGAQNPDSAQSCRRCGHSLRFALQLHDPDTLVEHYRIVRILGYGGFGAVYEAENIRHPGQLVALKETLDPRNIHSFRGEFAVLHSLQHPHLPCYYERFETQGNGYLVMEFVPGQNLEDVLKRRKGPLVESQVLGYAIQLCDVLSFLHRQKQPILHRDIKPANVRLTPEGLIKLVDFGLVKQGLDATHSSRRAATPAYAPFEQYGGGRHTDQRSDIYSIGATLYHLFTGHEPVPSLDRIAASRDPLPNPRQLNPNLSAHLAETLTKAMALRPQDRYTNVDELKQALLGRAAAVAYSPQWASAPTIPVAGPSVAPVVRPTAPPSISTMPAVGHGHQRSPAASSEGSLAGGCLAIIGLIIVTAFLSGSMGIVGPASWFIFGGIAGWTASLIMGVTTEHSLLMNVIVGIIGAFIGGFLASLLGLGVGAGFSIVGLIVAVIGACILIWLVRLLTGRRV